MFVSDKMFRDESYKISKVYDYDMEEWCWMITKSVVDKRGATTFKYCELDKPEEYDKIKELMEQMAEWSGGFK